MWSRFVRALAVQLNITAFLANPVKYILGTLLVLAAPYLVYLFWGSLIVLALIVLALFLLYKVISAGIEAGRS